MKDESFFQRARGQLLNPIAKAVAAAEEVLDHNAEGHEREALLASRATPSGAPPGEPC